MNSFFPMIKNIALTGLQNQVVKDCDYFDENGEILYCGVCGEPRREISEFPDPTPEDPENKTMLLRCCSCRCDREAEEQRKADEQARRDMEYVATLKKASLMDEKFKASTFDTFETNRYNKKNLRLCRRYAEGFKEMQEKNQGLILWGGVGTGKTFAVACIANYLLEHKVPVVMTSFVKLLDIIQRDKDEEPKILMKLDRAALVIFDDLGAERDTSYALEKVYSIIDSRYRSQKPMIFTTNLTLNEMQEETDIRYSRIYDRIFEFCYPIQFTGPSWRKKAAHDRFEAMEKFFAEEG